MPNNFTDVVVGPADEFGRTGMSSVLSAESDIVGAMVNAIGLWLARHDTYIRVCVRPEQIVAFRPQQVGDAPEAVLGDRVVLGSWPRTLEGAGSAAEFLIHAVFEGG